VDADEDVRLARPVERLGVRAAHVVRVQRHEHVVAQRLLARIGEAARRALKAAPDRAYDIEDVLVEPLPISAADSTVESIRLPVRRVQLDY